MKSFIWIFILLGMASLTIPEAKSLDLRSVFDNVVGSACSVAVGAVSGGKCQLQYLEDVKPLLNLEKQYGSSDDEFERGVIKIRGSVKYCCALAKLRSCILDSIKNVCGDNAESMSRSAVSNIVRVGGDDNGCTGAEFYFQDGSPFCWSDAAQFVLFFFIGLTLLSCICCGFIRCCCSRR